jgi:hypothetical protein
LDLEALYGSILTMILETPLSYAAYSVIGTGGGERGASHALSGLTNASTAVQFVPVTLRAIDVNIIEH